MGRMSIWAGSLALVIGTVSGGVAAARDDDEHSKTPPRAEQRDDGPRDEERSERRSQEQIQIAVNGVEVGVQRGDDGVIRIRVKRDGETIVEKTIETDRAGSLGVRARPVEDQPERTRLEVTLGDRVIWSKDFDAADLPPLPESPRRPRGHGKSFGEGWREFGEGFGKKFRERFGDGEGFEFGPDGLDREKLERWLKERFGDDFEFEFEMPDFERLPRGEWKLPDGEWRFEMPDMPEFDFEMPEFDGDFESFRKKLEERGFELEPLPDGEGFRGWLKKRVPGFDRDHDHDHDEDAPRKKRTKKKGRLV